MRAALERRVQALELMGHMEGPSSALSTLELVMFIGLALRRGGGAKAELDAADASLEPERRVKLTKTLEGARVIGKLLTKYRVSASVPAPLPADPPLSAEDNEVSLPTEEESPWQ